jgi:hypothetical protein
MDADEKPPTKPDAASRPSIYRLQGNYSACRPEDNDYRPSDLISLLRLRHAHPMAGRGPDELAIHFQTFSDAVARGLGVQLDEEVFEAFGAGRGNRALRNWLHLRATTLEVVNPFRGVIEGDAWGRRELEGARREALEGCIADYRAATLPAVEAVYAIDRGICVLLGWDPDARVSAADLRERHGATTEYDPFDFF